MSTLCKVVKRYYDTGKYSKDDVKKFVKAGKLTAAEYKEITGEEYVETDSESEGA